LPVLTLLHEKLADAALQPAGNRLRSVLIDNAIAGLPSSVVNVTPTDRLEPTTAATLPDIDGVTLTEALVPADPSELAQPARHVRNATYAQNARTAKHCMVSLPQRDASGG
jgi:hypothetical protein